MPMNRVQFQKGMSLGEFTRRYGTEEDCERELEAQRWPEGFVCPSCGGREHSKFVCVRRTRLDDGRQDQAGARPGCQRCGSKSSIRLAVCVGSRSSTSRR